MRRFILPLCVTAAALITVPRGVDAQGRPQTRQGFFIGFGFGGGSYGCGDCGDRETGGTGHLKLGGTLSPQLLLGAESSGWLKNVDGGQVSQFNGSVVAQFYPSATSGFFVKGGIGASTREFEGSSGGFTVSASETGVGLTAALGYDIRLGTNFSLSPYGNFNWGNFDGGAANNVQLGLGAMFH